jgi:hypothetical protein
MILFRILAIIGLLLTIGPSVLHFFGQLESSRVNVWMIIGMVVWFISAFIWYGRKRGDVQS